jgi:hypothetical protein
VFFLLIALTATTFAADLFHDDFSHFPPGRLSGPIGEKEYHYLPHRGVPLGPWANPICYLDAWLVSDEDGKPYLEQNLSPTAHQFAYPIFLTGDSEWSDYAVEASLALHLPLEKALRVRQWRGLGAAPFPYDTTHYYQFRVETEGSRIRAYVDGKLLIEAADPEIPKGKSGVIAGAPARCALRIRAPSFGRSSSTCRKLPPRRSGRSTPSDSVNCRRSLSRCLSASCLRRSPPEPGAESLPSWKRSGPQLVEEHQPASPILWRRQFSPST